MSDQVDANRLFQGRRSWLCAALGLALAGCGPTNAELVEQNRALTTELSGKAKALVEAIEAAPLTEASRCTPATKLTLAPDRDDGDTDYAMIEDLRAGAKQKGAEGEGLRFSFSKNQLPYFFVWSDPSSEYFAARAGQKDQRATPLMVAVFKRVKSLRYVIVLKSQPVVRDKGDAAVDVYLTSMDPPKVVCGFRMSAHADPKLGVQRYDVVATNRKTGEERVVRSDATDEFANALWSDARQKLAAELSAQLNVKLPE